ncbi:SDR family oxidoreductase [Croceivirga thetidis]|uniref:SDR family oxidoreductase n=1 Tax=Croceivirga thetidis TaxID=2721623 RepID=A0ABX1GTJ3_9FLAO|nr:SDR family oxidoreductase [Croceivirga thetidis]NKI32366.1 SDR family oxidoreductase [Croceivirga thetidis]
MGNTTRKWALILGGSSGLGLATATKLAKQGFNLILVHRNRRTDLEGIESTFQKLRDIGAIVLSFNVDATNGDKQDSVLEEVAAALSNQKIKVLVHSIAKGNLKPMYSENRPLLNHQDFELTISAMALSLYDWIQKLIALQLFESDSRIVAFTSEGSSKIIPNYAAVSAAKTTLESLTKAIAVELAPIGIKANCIQAGVCDTASFRLIPNSELIAKVALNRNPNRRLTTVEDVANAVYLLTTDEAKWITGNVLKVDGGESLC